MNDYTDTIIHQINGGCYLGDITKEIIDILDNYLIGHNQKNYKNGNVLLLTSYHKGPSPDVYEYASKKGITIEIAP